MVSGEDGTAQQTIKKKGSYLEKYPSGKKKMEGNFSEYLKQGEWKSFDETGNFPTEIVKQLGEMGLMGMMVEEKWGGAGLDTVTYAMAMEAVSAA